MKKEDLESWGLPRSKWTQYATCLYFNSRPRKGDDNIQAVLGLESSDISIHVPTRGTTAKMHNKSAYFSSIHKQNHNNAIKNYTFS